MGTQTHNFIMAGNPPKVPMAITTPSPRSTAELMVLITGERDAF